MLQGSAIRTAAQQSVHALKWLAVHMSRMTRCSLRPISMNMPLDPKEYKEGIVYASHTYALDNVSHSSLHIGHLRAPPLQVKPHQHRRMCLNVAACSSAATERQLPNSGARGHHAYAGLGCGSVPKLPLPTPWSACMQILHCRSLRQAAPSLLIMRHYHSCRPMQPTCRGEHWEALSQVGLGRKSYHQSYHHTLHKEGKHA